jgi:hypothetical protein
VALLAPCADFQPYVNWTVSDGLKWVAATLTFSHKDIHNKIQSPERCCICVRLNRLAC